MPSWARSVRVVNLPISSTTLVAVQSPTRASGSTSWSCGTPDTPSGRLGPTTQRVNYFVVGSGVYIVPTIKKACGPYGKRGICSFEESDTLRCALVAFSERTSSVRRCTAWCVARHAPLFYLGVKGFA